MQYSIAAPYAGSCGLPLVASPGPILEIQSGPTDSVKLMELSCTLAINSLATTLSLGLGLGVASSQGVGVFENPFLDDNDFETNALSGATVITQWTTFPGVPANYLRRMSVNPSAAAGARSEPILFRFPRGISMPASSSLVLWLLTTTGALSGVILDPNVVIDA